jgi:hypothetical protein
LRRHLHLLRIDVMNSSASCLMLRSNVAENSSVWRVPARGEDALDRGRKPMSSMRSASSSTSSSTASRLRGAALHVVEQAARARDQDVDAAAQLFDLRLHAGATVDAW